MNRSARTVIPLLAVATSALLGWAVAAWDTQARVRDAAPHSNGPRKPAPLPLSTASLLERRMDAVRAAGSPSAQIAAAIALAASVASHDFARFLDNLDRLPPPSARRLAAETLMRRWVRHDPGAALRWCQEDDANANWVRHVAAEWAKQDPTQAEAIIQSISNARPFTLAAIATAFASQGNFQGALDLLLHPQLSESGFYLDDPRRDTLEVLADRDPDWLASRIDGLPPLMQGYAREAVTRALARRDVRAAFEWAAAAPQSQRVACLKSVVEGARDPSEWLTALAALPADLQGAMRVRTWFDRFELGTIVDALISHAPRLPDSLRPSLMEYLDGDLGSSSDPGKLATRILAVDELRPHFSVANFVNDWMREAPAATKAWIESLQDESLRAEARETFNGRIEAIEQAHAISQLPFAERWVMDAGKNQFDGSNSLLALDPSTRQRVLEADLTGHSPDGLENPFRTDVIQVMSERYPSETARWLSENLTGNDSPKLATAARTTASWWAADDPQSAAAWAAALPPGDTRAWAAANVAIQWRSVDPAAARAWVDSLPAADRAVAARAMDAASTPPSR